MQRRGQDSLITFDLSFQCESARLLLIDDEPLVTRVVELSLKKVGFKHIISVNDPTLVMDVLENNPFDLIVLDIEMGPISGLDLLRKIRSQPKWNEISVIILSGSTKGVKYQALRMGAIDFIDKPFKADELELRVRNALRII